MNGPTSRVPLLLMLGAGLLIAGLLSKNPLTPPVPPSDPPPEQIAESAAYYDKLITVMAETGLLKEMKDAAGIQVFYVDGRSWRIWPYEKKKEFLGTLVASHRILKRSPYIEIRDYLSGKIYAEAGTVKFQVNE